MIEVNYYRGISVKTVLLITKELGITNLLSWNFADAERLKAKWMEEMKAQMAANDSELSSMKTTYEDKLKAQKKDVGVS